MYISVVNIDVNHVRATAHRAVLDSFSVRERSTSHLVELGEHVENILKDALDKHQSLEVRTRIKGILAKLATADGLGPHAHRQLRVAFILEKIGTPECKTILERLEREASNPTVRTRSRQALARLKATQ